MTPLDALAKRLVEQYPHTCDWEECCGTEAIRWAVKEALRWVEEQMPNVNELEGMTAWDLYTLLRERLGAGKGVGG